jgi:hypothetical protein
MRFFNMCLVRDVSPTSTDVEYSAPCVMCGTNNVIVVSEDDHVSMRWENSIPKHLCISTREFFMSGLCRSCQEEVFSDEDED